MLIKNWILLTIASFGLYGCSAGDGGIESIDGDAIVRDVMGCDKVPTFDAKTAEQLFINWNLGLQKYNAQNNQDIYISAGYFTMNFYTPAGMLSPSGGVWNLIGTQQLYGYFNKILATNPVMTFNPESNTVINFGCGMGGSYGSYAGYYTLITNPGTPYETKSTDKFVFTYEYKRDPVEQSFIVESGDSKGQMVTQLNQAGWYISMQLDEVLPAYK